MLNTAPQRLILTYMRLKNAVLFVESAIETCTLVTGKEKTIKAVKRLHTALDIYEEIREDYEQLLKKEEIYD